MTHRFLRAIGFSRYKTNQSVLPLLNKIIQDVGDAVLVQDEGVVNGQLTREFGKGFGLSVYGEFTDKEVFHPDYYFPYHVSGTRTYREVLTVAQYADRNAYCAMCEEPALGVSLIFYVINGIEYARRLASKEESSQIKSVCLSAFSVSGKILLPVLQREGDMAVIKATSSEHKRLMEAAKNGDSEAMENLAIEDMSLAHEIDERSSREDIYTIVNTSFMPFGLESDQYTAIGVIEEYELVKNALTDEEMYRMIVQCNDIRFSVMINRADLLGVPEVGRRFKGEIWLQGLLEFA